MAEDNDLLETVNASTLKKPGFVCIKGQPCKITELNQKPKATVGGNDKLHVVGTHVFTGKKYEDTLNLTAGFASQVKVGMWGRGENNVYNLGDTRNLVCISFVDSSTNEFLIINRYLLLRYYIVVPFAFFHFTGSNHHP